MGIMGKEQKLPEITLSPITGSSQIVGAGYHAESQTLALRFTNGQSHYRYKNVPPELWDKFMKAESKGKFFGANIRGKFEHLLIPEQKAEA